MELNVLEKEIEKRGIEDDELAIEKLISEIYESPNARVNYTGYCAEYNNNQGSKLFMKFPRRKVSNNGWNDRISSHL